ncbi:MAG: bifunctional tetrahydrofolate synthase/dihydrofolate synthase [Thiogranum sp.]|nr:bifunctional tetrahydrofolate synthase/dihydrofolate synthase [Thiogranum sp.]
MAQQQRFTSLQQWLSWQETLHPSAVDLGLQRVSTVADRLGCGRPARIVITVGGTNGKGSCQALLEAILLRAGYRVGIYSSPHLVRYNERVRLNGATVSDQALCDAFARIDRARDDTSLTYFEFGTLAALDIMRHSDLDVAVLEVGLGGRLDAVNIVDADASLVSSIGIDHTEWLGSDRDSIGREKAGIFRPGKPAVCGDRDPPDSIGLEARRIGALLRVLGRDFQVRTDGRGWHWQGERNAYRNLPQPALPGAHQLANAASVLMVLDMLSEALPVPRRAIDAGLRWMQLPGRIQMIPGKVEQVLDVSHNAQAALALVDTLRHMPLAGVTHAVIGMMKDKDVSAFVRAIEPAIAHWYPVGLPFARAMDAAALAEIIGSVIGGADPPTGFANMTDALADLRSRVSAGDRILVCGSFYTLAEWVQLDPDFE